MLTALTSRSIGQRLGLVLSLVLLVSFVGSGLGYRALSRVAEENKEMLENSLTSERLASDWYRNITNGAARTSAVAVSKDPALADFFAPVSAESSKQSGELQKRLKESLNTPEELAMFDKVSEARKAYLSSRDAVFAAKKAGDDAKAQQAFEGQFVPANKQFLELMDKLLQTQRQELDAAAARAQDANVSARIALAVFSVFALIVGAGLSLWLTRSITRPLNQAADTADAIANFDLTRHIEVRGQDETGRLLRSLQQMQAALLKLIGEVRGSTDSITTASAEIATGNMDLSQRTEQTASHLQQAAASMTQLTGTVRQTTDAATTANQLASSAAEVAQRGGQVVSQVVSTMDDISNSSRRISDIIGTIDGIAFQTNILALNAAVEAARAGEQGRGFAVVAGEVRSLAQRSAQAAGEIRALIGSSTHQVTQGVDHIHTAHQGVDSILGHVGQMSSALDEMNTATREQTLAVDQVAAAVRQIGDEATHASIDVEQTTEAATRLNRQADELMDLVAQLKVG